MTRLPDFLRKLPYAFYFLAALMFVWTLANGWLETVVYGALPDPTFPSLQTYQKSFALLQALERAAYLVSNGAIIHVLIAIFDRLGAAKEAAE